MILSNIYFVVKPYLPWGVRVFLRRRRAESRKRRFRNVWPIDPSAGAQPPNWQGWPNNKRFAVVLTHDVEGAKGLSRTLQLMEIERKHGFRSSFNFVPKGDYRVDDPLRDALDRAGFEVGVHGLEHDGKLYKSKAKFAGKAKQIRECMQKWNATGFRSPLMQHKLGWLHQLGVDYDGSTFDTDPFEPQPDGVRTIFPFWVPSPSGGGYVELPYTLVQDFTLFTILLQTNTDVWKSKVDWIAARGGMVLLNTHPDYICFEGTQQRGEYPLSYYEEFLAYLNSKYESDFWSALPREVARFYRSSLPSEKLRNTRRRVCIVTRDDSDERLRQYTEALVNSGDQVEVIALATDNASPAPKYISGVAVDRLKCGNADSSSGWRHAIQLLRCFVALFARLTLGDNRVQNDLVHFCNVPPCLVFSAWHAKNLGAKLLLDFHDPVPTCAAVGIRTTPGTLYTKCLRSIEAAAARFVDHCIGPKQFLQGEGSSLASTQAGCVISLASADVGTIGSASQKDAHSNRTDSTPVLASAPGEDQTMTGALLDDRTLEANGTLCVRNGNHMAKVPEVGKDDYLDIVTSLLAERF